MEDQVDEIKRKVDIVEVVGAYVSLKKMGRHQKGLCPFHAEKTASFIVNEEMGMYKCFGCGAGGDVIKFLMEIEGIEFRDALERLAERAGVKLVYKRGRENDEKAKLLEIMELAARYYHWLLKESKAGFEAREYLKERKVNEKLIETFNLGFSLPSWDGLVKYLSKKKGYEESLLEKVGLVSKSSKGGFYDKFRGRVMFPLQDSAGKVVGFTGRVLPKIAKEGEPKYLNSPETILYHKGRMLYGFTQAKTAIREKKRVVLVEGQMDCVSSFGAGVTETVAVGGTALTEEQIEMLARLAETVYLSLDADEAGNVAMKRSVELAEKRGLGIKVVQIDGGKDPDEIARNSPEKWRGMVEKATDVYEHVMENAFKKYGEKGIEGVKKISEEVVPFLVKIENNVVREVWAKRLAEKLGIEMRVVTEEIMRTQGKIVSYKKTETEAEDAGEISRVEKMAKRLAGLLMLKMSLGAEIASWFSGLQIPGSGGRLVFWLMKNGEKTEVAEMMETVPDELKSVMSESYMGEEETEEPTKGEVQEAARLLIREVIKERKRTLMEQMNEAKKNNDDEKQEEILREINDLNKKESRVMALG